MLSLINYTHYSYGRSLMTPEEIVAFAKKAGQPLVAITDHHSLSGVPEFMARCEAAGIKGVIGLTLNVIDSAGSCGTVVLLAKDQEGFKQLRQALDDVGHVALQKSFDPTIGVPREQLLSAKWHESTKNCLMLDGYPGSFSEQEIARLPAQARTLGGVKSALQTAGTPLSTISTIRPLGYYYPVCTPGEKNALGMACLSLNNQQVNNVPPVLDSLVSLAANDTQLVAAQHWFSLYAQNWLEKFPAKEKATAWVIERYRGRTMPSPKAIPQGMAFEMTAEDLLPFFEPIPESYNVNLRADPLPNVMIGDETLDELVEANWPTIKALLPEDKVAAYRQSLDFELEVIKRLGFENYFKNIYQIKMLADKTKNPLMLRGSAVSALTMQVMGLTPIDPIEEKLLFYRFLNEDRASEPDVDIEAVNQPKMLEDIRKTFGDAPFATLISDNGMSQAKLLFDAARDAMMSLYPLSEQQQAEVLSAYEKLTAYTQNTRSGKVIKQKFSEWLGGVGKTLQSDPKNPAVAHLVELAKSLDKGASSSSISSSSIVVIPEGVNDHFNLLTYDAKDPSQGKSIPFTKESLPYTGFIKYDILRNHAFKRLCLALQSAGLAIEPNINKQDRAISYVFNQGATLGVTQLNGFVGRRLSEQFRPRTYDDIVALVALIRVANTKGDSKVVERFVKGLANPQGVKIPEPLRPFVGDTYGVMVYEEQLMELLRHVGQFSMAEADRFRSSLKKGRDSVIDEFEPRFIKQVSEYHKISEQEASQWYEPFREKRGRFTFAKAHAVAYARVAMQQCWFKTYYPAHYAAELFLDTLAKADDKPIKLEAVLTDWGKVVAGGWPQKEYAKTFLNALGKIVLREQDTPNDGYKPNLARIDADIRNALAAGWFEPVFGPGENAQNVLAHWDKVVTRLATKLDVVPVEIARKHAQRTGVKNDAGNGTPPKQSESGEQAEPGERDTRTLNEIMAQEPTQPWLEKVMIAQLIPYFEERGLITVHSRDTGKARYHDHFKFKVNGAKGKNYHLCVPADDEERINPMKMKELHTGMHQGSSGGGGSKKIDSLNLFKEIVEQGMIPELASCRSYKDYHEGFKQWVLSNPTPLNSVHNLVAKIGLLPPMFAGQIITQAGKRMDIADVDAKDCLEVGRGFSEQVILSYYRSGSLCNMLRLNDEVRDSKKVPGTYYRMEHIGPMATYVQVEPGRPLYNPPPLKSGYLSEGGHQNIYRQGGKVGRPDYATKSVYGHYFGHVTPNAQTLWVAEGMFDAIAFNELQTLIPSLAPDRRVAEPNCIGLKSTQNVKIFFEKMLNIRLIDTDQGGVDFQLVEHQTTGKPINDESRGLFKKHLEQNPSLFVHDRTAESEEAYQTLRTLYQVAGVENADAQDKAPSGLKVFFCTEKKWLDEIYRVTKFEANRPGMSVFHKGNISQFLRGNNLTVQQEGDKKVMMRRVDEKVPKSKFFSAMTDDEKKECAALIRKRFTFMSGAQSLGLALDNDSAGIVEAMRLKALCSLVELPCVSHMPERLVLTKDGLVKIDGNVRYEPATHGAGEFVKDHNDFLVAIKKLMSSGQHEILHQLIDHYVHDFQHAPGLDVTPETPALTHEVHQSLKRG